MGSCNVAVLLLVAAVLVGAGVHGQVRLSDGAMTRFTISPSQPTVFTYTPPVVGDAAVPFQRQDDTSRWVRVNAHAQRVPLTVSVSLAPKPTKTASGLDVGVIQRLGVWTSDAQCLGSADYWTPQPPELVTITISVPNTTSSAVNAVVMAAAFTTRPPIPGGCCTTCVLDDDPTIALGTDAQGTLQASFDQADLGVPRADASVSPASAHECNCDYIVSVADTTAPALTYSLYRGFGASCGSSFHPDLSEDTYFAALSRMTTAPDVVANGIVHSSFGAKDIKRARLTLRPGQIAIYNVLVSDVFQQASTPSAAASFQSVYTPRVSYGCSFDGNGPLELCSDLGDAASVGMSVGAAIVGLYLAIFGHRWIIGELSCFGVLMFSVGTHLALSVLLPSLTYKVHIGLAGVGGLLGAALVLVLWRIMHWSSLCTVFIGLSCGTLVACVIFASPIGEYSVWQAQLSFAMAFACISAAVPVILLLLRHRWLSRISSSLVGTYCVLAGIDYFIGSSFSYIVLNIFNRATIPDFATASSGNYFGSEYNGCTDHTKNLIMFIAWLAAASLCLVLQTFVTASMDFPSSRMPLWGSDNPRPAHQTRRPPNAPRAHPKRDQALQPLIESAQPQPQPRRYRTFQRDASIQYANEEP